MYHAMRDYVYDTWYLVPGIRFLKKKQVAWSKYCFCATFWDLWTKGPAPASARYRGASPGLQFSFATFYFFAFAVNQSATKLAYI